MDIIKQGKRTLILLLLLVSMASWGFLGHRTAHQLAIYELPGGLQRFFFKNMEEIVSNAPRPDIRRNEDSTEATKHFIDLEMYGNDAINEMPMDWTAATIKYTKDSLLKYGYLPYHIIYMKEKLTNAFRNGNKDSILFFAADIGHYIEDANVPLHTSVNYDGQLTNQKGLHSLWESMIPELEIGTYQLSSEHKAKYLSHPDQAIWAALRRSANLVPGMLQKELEVSKGFSEEQKFRTQLRRGREVRSYTTEFAKAYAQSLGNTINEQLIHSADLVADFWYTCWVDAGKPDLQSFYGDWGRSDRQKLKSEEKAFKKNTLIEYKYLISKLIDAKVAE